MKTTLTIITLLLLISWRGIEQNELRTENVTEIQQTILEKSACENQIDTLISENFTIARFDFHLGELYRLFLVIPEDKVFDYVLILEIVCEIENHYKVYEHTRLSFFPDIKYADYKDFLFINENHPLQMTEYDKWMDSYYMAEFQYSSRDYQTYPTTQNMNKRKKVRIKACI